MTISIAIAHYQFSAEESSSGRWRSWLSEKRFSIGAMRVARWFFWSRRTAVIVCNWPTTAPAETPTGSFSSSPSCRFDRLCALRLLHGNYPASARSVALRDNKQEIGRMHVVNLLRLRPGVRFRFAGKVFEVAGVTHEVVEVRHSRANGQVIDLSYPGGAPSVHPVLLHDVLEFLATGTIESDLMTAKDADWLGAKIARLRPLVQDGGIPFIRTQTGIAHLTFAGTLFNRTIAVSTGAPPESSDDLWLVTKDLIRSSDLRSYEEYRAFLPQVVDATEKPTLFQALLPPELRLGELQEAWFKTATHTESLARLSAAKSRPADPMLVAGLV